MFRVHICDDNEGELIQIKKAISFANTIIDEDLTYGIVTSDYEELIDFKGEKGIADVFFLDIDLNQSEVNGLQLAVKIRENNPHAFICFVTTHAEMSYLTFKYKVMAFDFIIKEQFEKMLASFVDCLEGLSKQLALQEQEDKDAYIELQIHHEVRKVLIDSIIAFETVGNHKIRLYGEHHMLNLSKSISDMKKLLPNYFLNFNRSYLVNSKKVVAFDRKSGKVEMSNGLEIYVPVRKKTAVFSFLENRD